MSAIINPRNTKQLEEFTLKLMMDGKGVKVFQVASELRISEQQATKVMRGLWRKALVKPYFHDPKAFAKFNVDQVLSASTWVSSKLRSSVKRGPAPALSSLKPTYSVTTFGKFKGGDAPGNGQFKGKSKEKKRKEALAKLGKGDEGRKMPVIEKVRDGSAPGAQSRAPQSPRQAPTRSR